MATKKHHRHITHHRNVKAKLARTSTKTPDTLVLVRGWMFVVAFALMLGVGAVVGTFFNKLMNESTPTVAGAQIEVTR